MAELCSGYLASGHGLLAKQWSLLLSKPALNDMARRKVVDLLTGTGLGRSGDS